MPAIPAVLLALFFIAAELGFRYHRRFGGEGGAEDESQVLSTALLVLALLLLDTAIDWNGAKGAAFALLGSSSLAVIGFYVAILNLGQIRLVLDPEEEGEADTKPASPSNSYPS